MTEIVELDGKRYVWTGSRWYGEKDFVTPPLGVRHRLQALRPDTTPWIRADEHSVVHVPRSLRERWPDPLAAEWLEKYPQVFDADDYRCTRKQHHKHFWEWCAAVHVFERDGACSLVEKYDCQNHPVKRERLAAVLSASQIAFVDSVYYDHRTQVPDLFCYVPETGRFWFAEVKGPDDVLRANQAAGHEAIRHELGVPVEVIQLGLVDD